MVGCAAGNRKAPGSIPAVRGVVMFSMKALAKVKILYVIVWSSGDHFGMILGTCWYNLLTCLGSLWDRVGMVLGSFWDGLGIVLASF